MGMFFSKPVEASDGNTANDADRPGINARKIRHLFWAATFGRFHKWLKEPPTPVKYVDDGPCGTS